MEDLQDVTLVAEHLRRVLREAKISLREAEARLEMGKDYLSQLLRGSVDLKLKHVFAILRAADKDPGEFWGEVYPSSVAPIAAGVSEERLYEVVSRAVAVGMGKREQAVGRARPKAKKEGRQRS